VYPRPNEKAKKGQTLFNVPALIRRVADRQTLKMRLSPLGAPFERSYFEDPPAGLAAVELPVVAPDFTAFFLTPFLWCFLVAVTGLVAGVEVAGAEAAGLAGVEAAGACAPNTGTMVATARAIVNKLVFIFSSPCGPSARLQFHLAPKWKNARSPA
jgi:hypothetical protein